MTGRFHHEDDVTAAYDAAEFVVHNLVSRRLILVVDEREPAKSNTIRRLAREVADAVIRSGGIDSTDIADFPGVQVESVKYNG